MPKLVPVERDYTQILNKFDTIGPLVEKPGIPAKGIMLIADKEMDKLRRAHGTGRGAGENRPLVDTPIKAGDAVMHMSGRPTAAWPPRAGERCPSAPALR